MYVYLSYMYKPINICYFSRKLSQYRETIEIFVFGISIIHEIDINIGGFF